MPSTKYKLKQKERIIIFNLVVIVLFALVYFFIIDKTMSEINKINSSFEDQLLVLNTAEKKGQEIKRTRQNISTVETLVSKLSSYFIKNNLEFVTTLENLAAKHELQSKITMGSSAIFGRYKKIVLTIYLQGDHEKQLYFVNELQSLPYYLNIQSIEVVQTSDTTGNMTLIIDSFWDKNAK